MIESNQEPNVSIMGHEKDDSGIDDSEMPSSQRKHTAAVPSPTVLPPVVEIQRSDREEAAEMSGRGRRKRAPRHIGDLNGCLCGLVVNPSVDLSGVIKCRQPSCETQWYHLQCVALEQAPTKWT